jgi:hypothetical protein
MLCIQHRWAALYAKHDIASCITCACLLTVQVYDETKAATVAAALGPLVMLVTGMAARMSLAALLASGVFAPAVAAALIAR